MVRTRFQPAVAFLCLGLFSVLPGGLTGAQTAVGAEEGTFTGSWMASGTKDVLPFGQNREAALFKLSGHVSLKQAVGGQKKFWAECIGLADNATGSNARCVWRGPDGQEIYLTLQSRLLEKGASVSGTFVGGSGPATAIEGTVNFEWSTMTFHRQNNVTEIGGYSTNLSGSYRLP